MRESIVEAACGDYVEALGGRSVKLDASTRRGIPDRMYLVPPGIVFFVEHKGTRGRPEPLQLHWGRWLVAQGFRYMYAPSYEDFTAEIEEARRLALPALPSGGA